MACESPVQSKPFNPDFIHYCANDDSVVKMVCEMAQICRLNLGKPEMRDLDDLSSSRGEPIPFTWGILNRSVSKTRKPTQTGWRINAPEKQQDYSGFRLSFARER